VPLVDFASVNPDTELEELNLNWTEKDLPERVRTKLSIVSIHIWENSFHRLLRYFPGSFVHSWSTIPFVDLAPH